MATRTQEYLSPQGRYRYHDVVGLLSAGGPGFSNPVAVALGPDGLMYVANRSNPNQPEAVRVTRCTRDGEYIDQFGGWGAGDGQFIWVTDIAFSHRGELLLADELNQRISAFTREGSFLYSFGQQGTGPGQLNRPSGLAFDRDDHLYVVDSLNHRVQRLTREGQFLAQWGGYGTGEATFNMPWGIALDRAGHVYVTDWRNDRVQKFTPEGRFLLSFGRSGSGEGELDHPNGIAVDGDGDVYVCDWRNDRVQVFDSQGHYRDTLIGHSGVSRWARVYLDANLEAESKLAKAVQNIQPKMRFYRPTSVKVDADGKVFVVDCYRHRVQIYQKLAAPAG